MQKGLLVENKLGIFKLANLDQLVGRFLNGVGTGISAKRPSCEKDWTLNVY